MFSRDRGPAVLPTPDTETTEHAESQHLISVLRHVDRRKAAASTAMGVHGSVEKIGAHAVLRNAANGCGRGLVTGHVHRVRCRVACVPPPKMKWFKTAHCAAVSIDDALAKAASLRPASGRGLYEPLGAPQFSVLDSLFVVFLPHSNILYMWFYSAGYSDTFVRLLAAAACKRQMGNRKCRASASISS
jgi:hypothetical protein